MRMAPVAGARRGGGGAAVAPISVDDTINSGQVFLWEREEGAPAAAAPCRWTGIDGQAVVRLRCGAAGGRGAAPAASSSVRGRAASLLRSGDDMRRILGSICEDGPVRAAVARYPGLRLLRQDPFQCLVSFVASSNSSIRNIRSSLRRMCARYGREARFGGAAYRLFPTPEALAGAGDAGLAACSLGYRAGYVRAAAEAVASGRLDLDRLRRRAGYGEAMDALLGLPGVGRKVADCVLLFSLDKLEAFPIDRWTTRALGRLYPGAFPAGGASLTPRRYERMHGEIVGRFGPYAGYAQQFLFKAERDGAGGRWLDGGGGGKGGKQG